MAPVPRRPALAGNVRELADAEGLIPARPTIFRNIVLSGRFSGFCQLSGKLRSGQASDHPRLYQATEIRSRSAATRWTWMTRRRASETLWLMYLVGRRKLRTSSKARQKRSAEPNALKLRIDR